MTTTSTAGFVMHGPNTGVSASIEQRVVAISATIAGTLADEGVDLAGKYNELRAEAAFTPASVDAAVALAATALRRSIGVDPYPVQLAAAVSMCAGFAAEMATGEGKTVVGFLASVAFAVCGPVHVATANAYLAERDQQILEPAFETLGLSSTALLSPPVQGRVEAYAHDVVFATLSTIGIDELTDRVASSRSQIACGRRWALVVDEADAILLDDAITPIALAKPGNVRSSAVKVAKVVETLDNREVIVDDRSVLLTSVGNAKLNTAFAVRSVWDHHDLAGLVVAALAAKFTMRRDREYLVRDGIVVMLNEQTGRADATRRTQGGLHEAVEAREALLGTPISITRSAVVVDNVPVADLVGLYTHVAAMSGTLTADAAELEHRYHLAVASFEPHRQVRRVVLPDLVHRDAASRNSHVATAALGYAANGAPVLIVAASMPAAERIAATVRELGGDPVLVTARNTADQAAVFAEAGTAGRITVTTAIAGRGVDIMLGNGDHENRASALNGGGLHVIGVGHFATARLDRQLLGRCARQGDPGVAQFHVALDDDNIDLPDVLVATVGAVVDNGPEEITKLPALARRITIAQAVYDDAMRDSRNAVTRTEAPLRAQRKAFRRFRDALLDADRTTLVRLAGQLHTRGAADGGPQLDALVASVTAKYGILEGSGYDEAIVDGVVRQLLLAFVDEQWAAHLARVELANTENTLANLTQLDASVEHHRRLTTLFDQFVAQLGERLNTALSGLTIVIDDEQRLAVTLL